MLFATLNLRELSIGYTKKHYMNMIDFYTFLLYNPFLKYLTQNSRSVSCKHIKDAFKAPCLSLTVRPTLTNLPSLSSIDKRFNSIQCLLLKPFNFWEIKVSFYCNVLTSVTLESLSMVLFDTCDVSIDLSSNTFDCVCRFGVVQDIA